MALRRALPILLIGLLVFTARGGALAQDTGPDDGGGLSVAALPGTGFTYQGELRSGGSPVNAVCDFQFSLWDAASSGAQLGGLHTKANVTVAEGRFTVTLNDAGQFGTSAFTGEARWLRIAVRCPAGGGGYTTLAPRQPLSPSPLALALPGLYTQQNITSTNVIGGHISNTVSAGVFGATIGGGGAAGQPNSVLNNYDTIGGGIGNTANGTRATVGGGEGNSAIGSRATVGGGQANTASGGRATVGGGYANIASGTGATVGGGGWNGTDADGNVAAGLASTIGGGYGNVVTTTALYGTVGGGNHNIAYGAGAVVGGGEFNNAVGSRSTVAGGLFNSASGIRATVGGGESNSASDDYTTVGGGAGNTASGTGATVGGGDGNTASSNSATVGGGQANIASGFAATVGGGNYNDASSIHATVGGGSLNDASSQSATVGGGFSNTASGDFATVCGGADNTASADYSVVCGGSSNAATGYAASIGGGVGNTASGDYATVAGGTDNFATGAFSFAAGRNAVAQHPGAFVWAGDSDKPVESSVPNQFLVQAAGGVLFAADGSGGTGCALAAGGGTWDCTSDRNAKANFAPVDGVAILNTLAALPIETWNFNTQDAAIRHIGPMAQDWYALFGLGEGDTTISAVDADGVALAAIQGLYSVVKEQQAENAALRERVAALEQGAAPIAPVSGTAQLALVLVAGLLAGAAIGAGAFALGRSRQK